jgi:hypothetical protein
MSELNYDDLVQKALKQVVRDSLTFAAQNGLPDKHHFYISFRTDHPLTMIPSYLAESHPEEMTIVLQYQFWDLDILDKTFEVTLSFNDIHERLIVPFDALTSFVDPSVKFGLQFTPFTDETHDTKPTKAPKTEAAAVRLEETAGSDASNVIMIDAFRKK